MRTVAVIQARAGSSRLPGKVLTDLAGRPVLEWVVRAARAAHSLDEVIVATSTESGDDAVADLARSLGVAVVRGSEDDVLSRFVDALEAHPADAVVRLTADCPLLDPALIDAVVGAWRAAPVHDYVSTVLARSLPRGLDVELVTARALHAVDATATAHDRVHVTSGVYADPDRFALLGLCVAPDAHDLRVTLDTPEDLVLLRAVVAELPDRPPAWREVVALLRSRPDLVALNADIEQKPLEAG
ncbi:cytidylyltransferase domain-containing protein [Oryzihumus leptocrescens]|uniref:Spore coat polysaccharide biosynthesis protein SpsF n=1 Tax=Oryzihumus leptocrescens TaxID=297536 RepID=A0A542ZG89_9MICO|nr:glycosyltransferase family protein [Oryzihumus leptocrescens]TQL59356.1 spore coat polysaccharide biosynthesis protein SpsF [Oryzihumus leptocrescens]